MGPALGAAGLVVRRHDHRFAARPMALAGLVHHDMVDTRVASGGAGSGWWGRLCGHVVCDGLSEARSARRVTALDSGIRRGDGKSNGAQTSSPRRTPEPSVLSR